MTVRELGHLVLYVRDVERSVAFYREMLGFRPVLALPGAAFLQAAGSSNDHDLGLFQLGPDAADSPSSSAPCAAGTRITCQRRARRLPTTAHSRWLRSW